MIKHIFMFLVFVFPAAATPTMKKKRDQSTSHIFMIMRYILFRQCNLLIYLSIYYHSRKGETEQPFHSTRDNASVAMAPTSGCDILAKKRKILDK